MPETATARERVDMQLLRRYHEHQDEAARETLVARFQPFVVHAVRRFRNGPHDEDDLLQVANMGLVKAIDRFDPSKGRRFVSFAAPTINGELKRYFRDHSWDAHVPRSVQEDHAHARATARREDDGGDVGLSRRQVEDAGIAADRVDDVLAADNAFSALSLDAPMGAEDASGDETQGAVDPGFARAEQRATILEAYRERGLSLRDRRILYLRFVLDWRQKDIARDVGVSQMQISRRLTALASQLREQGAIWRRRERER